MMIKLVLKTLPVSINRAYKSGNGRFYKSQEAKEAQEAMAWEARSQYCGKPLIGPVSIKIAFYWPQIRRDIDSGLKSTLDALTGIIYEDDRQVADLQITRAVEKADPRVEIVIESLV